MFSHRYLRLFLVVIAIASCLFVILVTARYGFSSLLVTYSLTAGNLTAAQKAIQVTPKDAEAHFAGAALQSLSGRPDLAVIEMERAVSLRPAHYRLWSELGLLRDQIGDTAGALKAFDEAVRRAPFYSQPRWNRGNVLLRSGQYEAAFKDLNQAAQSNPDLIPNLIDLAWGMSRGDVKLTEQLAQIDNDKRRIAFARTLARQGKAQEAIAQFSAAANVPKTIKLELVEQLLAKKAYQQAYELWKNAQSFEAGKEPAGAAIYDGGFEATLSFGEAGFGWRVPRQLEGVSIRMESGEAQSGSKNLSIDFGGNSNPGLAVVSQLMLVEPSRRYKINFAGRSHELVTGGLPILVVVDSAGPPALLGQSSPLAKGTTDWQHYSFEFTTTPQTTAVLLMFQRESCTTSPCPIFGSISLDSFSVEQLP